MKEVKNKIFNHFKIHTQYSICEGSVKINDLKEFCKKNKIQAVGLSDTSNLCGALEFSENISKSGTQPIIGTQIIFKYEDQFGLIPLIAKNQNGYKKIIELSSKSYLDNSSLNGPFCEFNDLVNNPDGLIIFSGTVNGLIGNLFNKGKFEQIENIYSNLKKTFKNDFYIEIQRHDDQNEKNFEKFNLNISNKLNIPIIASHEIYYLDKKMYEAHDALMCIGSKTHINDKNRLRFSNQHYFKSSEQMFDLFSDLPEALENNIFLPIKCSFRPLPSKPMLPNINSNKRLQSDEILKIDSEKGLIDKFSKTFQIDKKEVFNHDKFKIYNERLYHELTIIIKMNYASYFLIVSDYIKWAKKNDIPVGPGRGSGAGSLVAWCLEITDLDPIKFNLIFERFLNPDRVSMPDFDIDFCEEKRDLVFNYLNNKYKNSVAHIITFGKLKARMVIRDVGRVLGLPYGFVDSICKMIPFDPSRPMSLTQCINVEPRLQKLINEDKRVKKLIDLSLKLEGLNRNVATHAAGVVIADKKLTETVPLYRDSSSNLLLPSTQFDMYSAENAGLVKFDFLGLKTLTVIKKTQELVNNFNKEFKIENINYEDQKVYDFLSTGNTIGLFQLESSGMRDALTQMKPNRLEDIIALVALYRPGPMNNITIYNDCKNKKKEPDYIHSNLEEILKPTYGVIIYQEQIMQIAQTLSGFSPGEADILRKAIGKKKRSEVEKQKERFIAGAVEKGIKKDIAAGIFLKIEPFAEYGFNKSHAAAYAIIAYQTAYLKSYFPHEFFAASMSMELSNQKKLSEFYEELLRLKINVVRPDINKCFANFTSDNNNFYYALGAIKNVGYEAIANIVAERIKNGNFTSINNFLKRVNPKDINKLQLEGLVKSGAFDSLIDNRKSIYDSIPSIILKSKNEHENKLLNQINLFEDKDFKDNLLLEKTKDWEIEEKLSKEFETIGFFISDHPLNQYKNTFKENNILNYHEFITDEKKYDANIAATVLKVQEKKTQSGNSYAIVKFSDLSCVFELFIFSETFEINRKILTEGNSLYISLLKNKSHEANRFKKINVIKIILLKDIINKPINEATFILKNSNSFDNINFLSENGKTKVKFYVNENGKKLVFKLRNKRKVDKNAFNDLKNKGISTLIE